MADLPEVSTNDGVVSRPVAVADQAEARSSRYQDRDELCEVTPEPERSQTFKSPQPLRVFISYRVKPDGPIASALKKLIESSIDPQPEVFVSGDGGLRPSNLGFKQQLQEAAQRADAFVAIISNASKEREWIFFEAGAAWGRSKTYVPVLVGALPDQLPSTIGDYQALNSQSKEEMLTLITSLAECVGSEVIDRFGSRYRPFAKMVEEHLSGNIGTGKNEHNNELIRAYRLGTQGDVEQSNELFDRLEKEAEDSESRCQLRIFRLQSQKKADEFKANLALLEDEFCDTSIFNYYMADETDAPRARDGYLARAIEIQGGRYALVAMLSRARLDFRLGETDRGKKTLIQLIQLNKGTEYAAKASKALVELMPELEPLEKLLIFLAGLSDEDGATFQSVAEIARKSKWNALHLHCATRFDAINATGTSANERGIARASLDLPSLAYESYSKAASLGVSVARCNMAELIMHASPAAAALSPLNDHTGPFDALDRGYPHEMLAFLEREHEKESVREREMLAKAESQFVALWAFAESAIKGVDSAGPLLDIRAL